jgi:nucleotide-binding universal stress UspA family protein
MDAEAGRIVVGYNGGAEADVALAWAVRTARLEHRPLRVVVASNAMDPVLGGNFHQHVERLAEERLAQAQRTLTEAQLPDAAACIAHGPTLRVLLYSVGPEDVLVVGSQGHGPFFETIGGSISRHLARHASCPVVVVRPPSRPDAHGIVVGVDGSPESLVALRFACARARRTGEEITVLHAYRFLWPHPSASAALAGRVREWVGPVRAEFVDVRLVEELAEGSASDLLVNASRTASLLVLGCRGRDALVDLLLGSTSQDALHQAHCPVAIVR